MSKMNIASNSFIVLLSKISVGFFIFLSQIILARFLGPKLLGVYNLFLEVIDISLLLGGLGFGTASIYLSNKEKKDFSKLFSNSLVFGIIWGPVLSLLTFFIVMLYPPAFSGLSVKYLTIALFIIPFVVVYNYLLSLMIAKFKIVVWSLFSVLYAFFVFSLGALFVVFLKMDADGAVYAILTAVLASFALVFFHSIKSYAPLKKFDFVLFISQLKFGISAYLGDVFSKINFKINIFIINIFLDVVSVGYYSVSYTMAGLIFLIPYSLQQVLYPAWSSASESEVDRKTPEVARQAFVFSLVCAAFLAFVGRFFILFFYGSEFSPSILPFYLILPGGVFAAFAGVFFNNFFAKGKPYIISLVLMGSLILNILLNIFFIPMMGAAGASLAASISYCFSALAAALIFWKASKAPLRDIFIVKASDVTVFLRRFSRLFTSVGKILNEIPNKDIEGLKAYYEKKAGKYDIINETFESADLYKKMMYSTRVDIAMRMMDISPSDNILEIGCGEGYYTKRLLEKTKNVTATDISENFLSRTKANTGNRAKCYLACPAEKVPFPSETFDKIFMSEVIEHLLDWRSGMNEAYRILKPGGIIVISTPSKLSYFNILCHIKILLRNDPLDGDHIKEFSRKELSSLIKDRFSIVDHSYTNYFPLMLPSFFEKTFGFAKIKKAVVFLENILSKIFFIKEQGLVFYIKAKKK